MFFLDKFWNGGIVPGEGRYHPTREYTEATNVMDRCNDILADHLSKEDYQVFREYTDAMLKAGCAESCENFIEGFRLGVRMMIDVLADDGNP